MTTAECKDKIKAIQLQALRTVGQYLMAEVKPYIPIDTGALQKSLRIEDGDDEIGSIYIVTGDDNIGVPGGKPTKEYAKYQYENILHHNVESGYPTQLMKLRPSGDETGTGHYPTYWRVYHYAKGKGLLKKLKTVTLILIPTLILKM